MSSSSLDCAAERAPESKFLPFVCLILAVGLDTANGKPFWKVKVMPKVCELTSREAEEQLKDLMWWFIGNMVLLCTLNWPGTHYVT